MRDGHGDLHSHIHRAFHFRPSRPDQTHGVAFRDQGLECMGSPVHGHQRAKLGIMAGPKGFGAPGAGSCGAIAGAMSALASNDGFCG